MHLIADYHTHTIYSHGRGNIEDNIRAALKRNLQAVAITDHGPGHLFIGVRGVPAFRRMQKEIERLRRRCAGIRILLGVEANIVDVDGTIDVPESILRDLDILLVGFHKLVMPQSLPAARMLAANFWQGWTKRHSAKLREKNTEAIIAAVQRYPVDIVTHPGSQVDIDTARLAAVCRQRGTALEINSSYGRELEGYIKAALPAGANLVINSDAHTPMRVGDFAEAIKLVDRLGIPAERIVNSMAFQGEKSRRMVGRR